jgi:hypothetical protein
VVAFEVTEEIVLPEAADDHIEVGHVRSPILAR